MDMPPGSPYADEAHYRQEMIAEWIAGSSAIDGETIAQWVVQIAQQRGAPRTREAQPLPPIAAPDALALSYPQAAALLGYSVDHFERHVVPDLRAVVKGRRKTIARSELVEWLDANSARALKGR